MRFGRIFDLRRMVWPWTTTKPWSVSSNRKGSRIQRKVRLPLLIELDTRADAGMDEQIIAEAAAVVEALEELDMLLRDRVADRRKRFLVAEAR